MNDEKDIIEQEIEIPYDRFCGLGLYIDPCKKENDVDYKYIIIDKTENKQIAEKKFNVKKVLNCIQYNVLLDIPIKVDPSHKFSVIITPVSFKDKESSVRFYVGEKNLDNYNLKYDNCDDDRILSLNIYGGESKGFLVISTIICEGFLIVLFSYIMYLCIKKKHIINNPFVQAGILGIILFVIMFPFTKYLYFIDEADYILGGIKMHDGYILYNDYVTQHMPFMYHITEFFTFLKATSMTEYRIYLNMLVALLYMGIFIRNKDKIGKYKCFILAIIACVFNHIINYYSQMCLAENLQAIFVLALFLEFYDYIKTGTIDFKRCVIVSACIFGGISNIFICVYQVFIIFIGVIINEFKYWKAKKITAKDIKKRYVKLFLICILPFLIGIIYLYINGNLKEFYAQAYKFNREVYSHYSVASEDLEFGTSIFKPIFTSVINLINILAVQIALISSNENIIAAILKLSVFVYFMISEISLIKKKKWLLAFVSFFVVSTGYIRKSAFEAHYISAWTLMLAVIMINVKFEKKLKNIYNLLLLPFALLIYVYGYNYISFAKADNPIVSNVAQYVINSTTENEKIFVDINSVTDTLYYVYKDRKIANRVPYVFSWFMEWYEDDMINELKEDKIKVVIYDLKSGEWGNLNNSKKFDEYLLSNYELQNSIIWKLK